MRWFQIYGRRFFGPAVLLLLLAALFVPWWVRGQVYGTFDLSSHTIPLEDLYARYQRKGDLPLWTPEIQGGFPMIANGFQSFFYPVHLALRQVLPGVWVANLSLLFHLWLAAIGMWLLLRREGFGRSAAFAGALVFGGSGYFLGRITLPHLLFPAAWIPWVLLVVFRAWRAPRLREFLLVSAVVGLQLFAGHLQVVLYTALLVATALGFLAISTPVRETFRRVKFFLLVPVAVFLLGAVHLLPVAELLPLSLRSEPLTGQELFDVSYPATHLLTWLVPDAFGRQTTYLGAKNEPELMTFFGILGLFLGMLGISARGTWKHPLGRTALVAVAVGFLLAGGVFSPFFRWLVTTVSPLAHLANPGRAILLVHVGWSLLAAFGWRALSSWSRRDRVIRLVLCLALVGSGGWWFSSALHAQRSMVLERFSASFGSVIAAVSLAVVLGLFLPRVIRSPVQVLLALVLAAELLFWGMRVNPAVDVRAFMREPLVQAYLPRSSEQPRVYAHSTLSTGSRPDPGLAVGPLVENNAMLTQHFVARQHGLLGVDVQLTWDGKAVPDGQVTLNVLDVSGTVARAASVPGSAIGEGEPVRFQFAPLEQSLDQPFLLQLTSTYARKEAPHASVFGNPLGMDFNPTGRLEYCRRGRCLPVASGAPTGADLAFRLRYREPPHSLDRELLLSFFGESFGLEMTKGLIQLQLASVARYQYEMGERRVSSDDNPFLARHKNLFNRFSIGTYVTSYEEHQELTGVPDLERVVILPLGNREIHVYRNTRATPKVHLARRIRAFAMPKEALHALTTDQVAPDEVTLVSTPVTERTSEDVGRLAKVIQDRVDAKNNAQVTVQSSTPRVVELATESTGPNLLVLRDVFFPGWTASLDGADVPIYLADVIFRGVVVPPGKHLVRFSYQPRAFLRGARISTVSWTALLIASAGMVRARWRRRAP